MTCSKRLVLLSSLLALPACERARQAPDDITIPARTADAPNRPAAPVTRPEPARATPKIEPPSGAARTEDERNTIDVFKAASPATVFVTQKQLVRDMFSMQALEVPAGAGTGFIWDDRGHIVTNFHVIRGATSVFVTLENQKVYPAKVLGADESKDIAVLKIDGPRDELVAVRLPPAEYKVEVGQKTVAIGNPFGLDHTLTTGVVSALGREVVGIGGFTIRDMIQTDAAINPGNSGGPLLDSQGQLIGMNTMIYSKTGSSAGVGFAVPVQFIRRVVPQIIERGRPIRVGIGFKPLTDPSIARRVGIKGVIVAEIPPGSKAARSGLRNPVRTQKGLDFDVVVKVDKYDVDDYDDLYNALDRFKPGDVIDVRVLRFESRRIDTIRVELIDVHGG